MLRDSVIRSVRRGIGDPHKERESIQTSIDSFISRLTSFIKKADYLEFSCFKISYFFILLIKTDFDFKL